MKRKLYIPIAVFLFVLLPLIAFSDTEQKLSESYYGQLKSLLTRKTLKVRPKASERDVNLVEVEKGAAGVIFGASMDDVVAIWGKPCGLNIYGSRDVWTLNIGACRFGFIDNHLVTISIHSATLKKAHLENGVSFESSFKDVKSAFGEPIEATDYNLKFSTKNGYVIKFHFVADNSSIGKRKLINIIIYHPDSGE
jgi:hypothetical protein